MVLFDTLNNCAIAELLYARASLTMSTISTQAKLCGSIPKDHRYERTNFTVVELPARHSTLSKIWI